jgi:hypothetical protein
VRERSVQAMLDAWRQDLNYAFRSAARTPAFTATVVVTLAIGIGASTAVFSIVEGVLVRPFSVANADRVLWLRVSREQDKASEEGSRPTFSLPAYLRMRDEVRSFSSLAAMTRVVPIPQRDSSTLREQTVTADFFTVVGAKPFIGRLFERGDDGPGARMWQFSVMAIGCVRLPEIRKCWGR